MTTINESNTVEAYIPGVVCGGVTHHNALGPGFARHDREASGIGSHHLFVANSQHPRVQPPADAVKTTASWVEADA